MDGLADLRVAGVRGIAPARRRVDDAAVDRDFVNAPASLDEFGANPKNPLDCGGQTGRPRKVVSFITVSNFDVQMVFCHFE